MRAHQLLIRAVAWTAVVAVLVLALTGPHIPAWLLAVAVVTAIALGIPASMKQKRIERAVVRRLWREHQRSVLN
jgi:MFS superfamily sulfate permease-like transporter